MSVESSSKPTGMSISIPKVTIEMGSRPLSASLRSPHPLLNPSQWMALSPKSPLAITLNTMHTDRLLSSSLKSLSISMKSVEGHFPPIRSPTESATLRRLEKEFCTNFTCCGMELEDLHSLMRHYEQCHGQLSDLEEEDETQRSLDAESSDVDEPSFVFGMKNQFELEENFLAVPMSQIYNVSSGTDAEHSDDTHSEDATEEDETSLTELEVPNISIKRRSSSSASARPTDKKKIRLPISPPATPEMRNSKDSKVNVGSPVSSSEALATDPSAIKPHSMAVVDENTGEKRYVCQMNGCNKRYKNANGLKYHLKHAHPEGLVVPKEFLDKKKQEEQVKPYLCTVLNCGKRYKNLNGLKYHIEHSHSSLLPPVASTNGTWSAANSKPMVKPMMPPPSFFNRVPFPHLGTKQ